jgi:hypothetical protein
MSAVPIYPIRVEGKLDPNLSRWLWLVKWLLAIPHYVALAFLWIAFFVLSVVAFFAILFTARYPRSIFDFNVGVLRWTWRVAFYSYGALGTDRYPPFTLAETPDYPATLAVSYPEQLSRGLVLVKWWLLAVPHYLVVGIFVGAGTYAVPGTTLAMLLVFFAAVALLFTRRYPRGIFDLVLGLNRWALRVAAYAALMTDAYPPFRLDLGGSEAGAVTVEQAPAEAGPRPAGWSAGMVLLVVLGSLATLVAVGMLAGGGVAVAVDQTQRDADGFVMTPTEDFSTGTYAIVSESVDVAVDGPDWAARAFLGKVRIRSESHGPVFVGIARDEDVAGYLAGVRRAVVTALLPDHERYAVERGGAPVAPPTAQPFWVASTVGAGEQELIWEPEDGSWTVVVMNTDAAAGVVADLAIGAELDALLWIGVGLIAGGVLFLLLGAGLVYAGIPKGR